VPFSIEDMLGHHTMVTGGGQFAGSVTSPDAMAGQVATPGDTATPTNATAGNPAGPKSKAAAVAENPTTWLIVSLGLGLALFWYGTGQLKVSV
jgi:hypothetical protein